MIERSNVPRMGAEGTRVDARFIPVAQMFKHDSPMICRFSG
jgi:hypothetical protein